MFLNTPNLFFRKRTPDEGVLIQNDKEKEEKRENEKTIFLVDVADSINCHGFDSLACRQPAHCGCH